MSQEQIQVPKGWEVKDLADVIQPLENGNRPKGGVKGITDGIPSLGGEHLNYNGGFNFGNLKSSGSLNPTMNIRSRCCGTIFSALISS